MLMSMHVDVFSFLTRSPGAVMFLFCAVPQRNGPPANILHTGDMRWQDWIRTDTILARTRVDVLYMDATYAAPRHAFPSQSEAIAAMAQVRRSRL